MQGVRDAATAALAAIGQCGPPPLELERYAAWCWRELGIDVRLLTRLPGGAEAFCYDTPKTGMRGRILLARDCRWPRFTLAHEVGHLLLGNGAAFSLACQPWQMLPAEREANAFAAALLIPLRDLMEWLVSGWTLEQIAVRLCAPEDAIAARMHIGRMLGEADLEGLYERLDRLSGGL